MVFAEASSEVKFVFKIDTTALAGTEHPMPSPQIEARTANMIPSHLMLSPLSKAYMAPPSMVPSSLLTRYFIAIKVSAYLVAIPKRPVNHIQRTAPGPPSAIAVPTPMMFAVPTVDRFEDILLYESGLETHKEMGSE